MKTYILNHHTFLSTCVEVEGKLVDVVFDGGSNVNPLKGGFFRTGDKGVQKALEARSDFNSMFKVDASQPSNVEDDEPGDFNAEYPDANTVQLACEVLNSEYDIPKSKANTKAEVFARAKELNINFPNLQP